MSFYELKLPNQKPPFPLILVLPILGRLLFLPDFFIERKIARFFQKRGFAAAILKRDFFEYHPRQGLEQVGAYIAGTVKLAKATLSEVLKNPAIDSRHAGSVGISFGAMINVLLAAEDPRLKACVVALGGGRIPEILTTSCDPLVKSYCRTLLDGMTLSKEALVCQLSECLQEEPLKAAPAVDPKKVLMIIAKKDKVVLPRYSSALREALKNPETIFLPLGHYTSLLALPYLNRKALAFFKKKFSEEKITEE